ncbi:hypothetical protein [Kitasatospora sp. NPDC017646]|uniref:hypothetical protein n=1 Tax=Kitasatospora sp. NPDC017646 TaxID=3364024 RepID=UPI0037BA63F9
MARAKAAATTAGAAPGPEVAPWQPVPAAHGARAVLLGHAALVADTVQAYLAAVDADPVAAHAAYEEFCRQHVSLGISAREAAEAVRDEAHRPDLYERERAPLRADEEATTAGVMTRVSPQVRSETARAESPFVAKPDVRREDTARAEKTADPAPAVQPAETARAKNPSVAKPDIQLTETARAETGAAVPAPAAPVDSTRAENLAAAPVPAPTPPTDQQAEAFEALRHQALTDPETRFGAADRLDDLAPTFGEGWMVASWNDPQAKDVYRLLHWGRPIGWTAPLPHGPWGPGGHIAAECHDDGTTTAITDNRGRARTHRDTGAALDALQRSYNESQLAPRVPTLTLGTATGHSAPTDQDLGTPTRSYALGDGLVHLTWPTTPGVQAIEQRGRLAGWTEPYDDDSRFWIVLIDGHPVSDAADNEPLLSANPDDALTLLRLALAQDLGSISSGWVLPRTAG